MVPGPAGTPRSVHVLVDVYMYRFPGAMCVSVAILALGVAVLQCMSYIIRASALHRRVTMYPRGIGIAVVGQWWSDIYGLVTPRYSVPCCSMYSSLNRFLAPVWLSGCAAATMGSLQPSMRCSGYFCCHHQKFGFGFGGAGRWWGGLALATVRQYTWEGKGPGGGKGPLPNVHCLPAASMHVGESFGCGFSFVSTCPAVVSARRTPNAETTLHSAASFWFW